MGDTQQRGQDKEGVWQRLSRMGNKERWGNRGSRQGGEGIEVGMQEDSHRHHICRRSYTILN